jgi:pimeloyl-ACP methyl ester carboxylesterase
MDSPTLRRRVSRALVAVLATIVALVLAAGAFYDPDPAPLRLARAHVVVNGLPVAYHQTGTGPDVVLLHGGMGSAEDFEPLIPLLAPTRRLTIVDRPGFGGSQARAEDCTFPGNARQVAGLIRALGLSRPTLVGHSHGGGVALRLAADEPALVSGLVLIAPAVFPNPSGPGLLNHITALPVVGPGLLAALGPLLGPSMIKSMLDPMLGPDKTRVPPDFVSWRARLWTAPRSLTAHARQQVTDGAGLADLQMRYAEMRLPTTAIWCDQDPFEGNALDTHRLATLLPNAKELPLKGCGHYVQYSQPLAVSKAILLLGAPASAAP